MIGGGGGGALRRVGKYEVGRTIGEGTFAKVKFAQNTETGESVAMKVLDRSSILKHKMVDQIKREISIMKLVRHPNVVRLYEGFGEPKEDIYNLGVHHWW
uniref:non-specific serine/threonine protein kinase n=1 Tax=Aegilops tauschii subsp. strangulata TaxID=200361 RepID=A0A453EVF0_AEGTS